MTARSRSPYETLPITTSRPPERAAASVRPTDPYSGSVKPPCATIVWCSSRPPLPDGVLGGDAALVGRALDQHHPPRDVAGGPDVRRRRLQAVVDLDVAPVRRDAGFLESQVVQVARPADGQHHGLDIEDDRSIAGPIGQPQPAVVARDRVDPADAGDHLDPVRREPRSEGRGDVLVLARHDARGELQERDRRAKGGEDGRELGPGRRRARRSPWNGAARASPRRRNA